MTKRPEKHDPAAGTEDAFSRMIGRSAGEEKQNNNHGRSQPQKGRLKKRLMLTVLLLVCLSLLIFCGLGIAGYTITASPQNLPNVYIDGINVGGLSAEDTLLLLREKGWEDRVDKELNVSLPADTSFTLDYVTAGAEFSAEKAAEAAYAYGRGGNWFENLFGYLINYVRAEDVYLSEKTLNEDYIRASMDRGIALMDRATGKVGYEVDTEKGRLSMIKGAGQIKLDENLLFSAISQALKDGQQELKFDTLAQTLTAPDFEKLYAELAVEPKDASFDENFEIVPEVVGCSFDVEAAKALWIDAEPGEEIVIPLVLTYPEIDGDTLRAMLFRDKLGGQTTYYTWSTSNRINNIHLAAEKLNGLVLLPGDVFSFNGTIGQRTEAAGFKMAGVYNDGQVVEDIGGGICQVSSTLYCAQMYAQLKTTNRVNHYFKVDYLDYGLDATVSWKTPDYKFTNSRDYPVKIVAYCDDENSALTIEIWGTDVDGSYVTLRQTSEALYDGLYTNVLVAYRVRTFRDVYDADGNWLDTISEPMGTYHLHDEDIDWPPEKYEQELTDFSDPLQALEKEKEKENEQNNGYLFDSDEYLGGVDIYS